MSSTSPTHSAHHSDPVRRCPACNSLVREELYQARSADEASSSVWTCGNCPLDPARLKFDRPRSSTLQPYPRRPSVKLTWGRPQRQSRIEGNLIFLRVTSMTRPTCAIGLEMAENRKHACSLAQPPGHPPLRAEVYSQGLAQGKIIVVDSVVAMSPVCELVHMKVYSAHGRYNVGSLEIDGHVARVPGYLATDTDLYKKAGDEEAGWYVLTALQSSSSPDLAHALSKVSSLGLSWPSAAWFVGRSALALYNNLSPRAWDHKRAQKTGAIYLPKVDGERVYAIIFGGLVHVFAKGRGNEHLGYSVLPHARDSDKHVVLDAENTVCHGMFFIDMLTTATGEPSPRSRSYEWSLRELSKVQVQIGHCVVRVRTAFSTLLDAESFSNTVAYPTDGVIALWPGSTTSRKMKLERSIELAVEDNGRLVTSDGDTLTDCAAMPPGVQRGDIVELRVTMLRDGKSLHCNSIFRRPDKKSANSTSAAIGILSSFSSVRKSPDVRRREVLIWCDALKHNLFRRALEHAASRKIVLDVGTGTGQSLDILGRNHGVSYILIEPSFEKCQALLRRAGTGKMVTDVKEISAAIRPLKSGSHTYLVVNATLRKLLEDEELMHSLHQEIAFVCAMFSAHFVVADLYSLCNYWSLPMVGCMYPYDGVDVGCDLVNALGVLMRRQSDSQCVVRWGGDAEYTEPYTTIAEYQSFCSVTKGAQILAPPEKSMDQDVWELCNKVYVAHTF